MAADSEAEDSVLSKLESLNNGFDIIFCAIILYLYIF
jgi:hypothetical protein